MSTETRSTLATTFAALAVIAALASATASALVAVNLSHSIQTGRLESIARNCDEQNARNKKAYVFLRGLPVGPNSPRLSAKDRAELIHGFTNALVGPVRSDCSAYAYSVVQP